MHCALGDVGLGQEVVTYCTLSTLECVCVCVCVKTSVPAEHAVCPSTTMDNTDNLDKVLKYAGL